MSKIKNLKLLPLLAMAGAALMPVNSHAAEDIEALRKAAVDILDASCSRCHQADKLIKQKDPASKFGNVLDLKVMVRDQKHVIPGNPDNSKLWKVMMDGTMPYDVYNGDFEAHAPTADDMEKIAAWIRAEGEAKDELLASRDFVSDEDYLAAIADDLRDLPGLKKKPSTSELLDWLKLLLAEDVPPEALSSDDRRKSLPPMHGALLKNEQDVHLFERLIFLNQRNQR